MKSSGAAKPATRYCVSAEWERLLRPLPVMPGADVGVTEPEYVPVAAEAVPRKDGLAVAAMASHFLWQACVPATANDRVAL